MWRDEWQRHQACYHYRGSERTSGAGGLRGDGDGEEEKETEESRGQMERRYKWKSGLEFQDGGVWE